MEKFDGGNFHLWKFKMPMMLSKHGLWKFVDGSATIPHDEDQITDYNEKATNAFALLCEHLTDAKLTHIQYCENVKSAWETLCGVHEAKTIRNKLFLRRRFFTIKMQEGEDLQVWSPCQPRMLTFNSSLLDCFMRFPKEKKVKVKRMPHCLTKPIRQMKSFAFIVKNLDTL
jgi:hypothetical protein